MLRRFVTACLAGLFVAGCSGPPVKEHDQATSAIAEARAGDAATYAPDELSAAEAAMTRYDGAVGQRDYRQALGDAIDARDRAYDALKQATAQKAAARDEATRLASDAEALLKTANARLAGARLGPAAVDKLRAAIAAASSALQEARTLIERQDYRDAVARLTPASDALRRDLPQTSTSGGRRGRGHPS